MTGLTDDVGFLLTRASGLVVRATNTALADLGLRVRQYSVLTLADDSSDGISQRDLAEVLGLDPSQVVALVDELAAAELVERRPSPTDRRQRLVAATANGVRLRRRADTAAAAGVQRQLGDLTAEEQQTLRGLLQRVVAGPDDVGEETRRAG
ncbi:MarR family winged helix-turn-helix transcriptional regulator [Petropleomorpha daqingensis]|uniref:DNA-binding MarR family transcriptional regulator n=1 Tax=Petropleomorpha daqingensis TaxID=2026353 RepID=A0A853CM83_9ACTN|nr:MarR family transcriptional regulator [Petropleomorpha daqingensis]NYJ07368.1 DNA-binding MarR family transcriptional regulator [Petropleomorpha daqingensis]